jgi:hypothetical protein
VCICRRGLPCLKSLIFYINLFGSSIQYNHLIISIIFSLALIIPHVVVDRNSSLLSRRRMFRSRIPGPAPLHNKAVRADGGTAVETVLIPRGGKHSCTDGSRRGKSRWRIHQFSAVVVVSRTEFFVLVTWTLYYSG